MTDKEKEYSKWYDDNCSIYNEFCTEAENIITRLLHVNRIPIHSIESRVKDKNSFIEKCKLKQYDDPETQLMDMAGIRIIAYINSDVTAVCSLIKEEFIIDSENSEDKSELMKENEVGYLSHHFIAKINNDRTRLLEYSNYKDLKCEIQVRTLLQHAWAEIKHDKNYKFAGELPVQIKRRFYLVAGTLELLDQEFQNISHEIEKYITNVKEKTKKGDLDMPIDSKSLQEYFLNSSFSPYYDEDIAVELDKMIIDELNQFGIYSIASIKDIMPLGFYKVVSSVNPKPHHISLIQTMMIINNPEKYFKLSRAYEIKSIPQNIFSILKEYEISKDDLALLKVDVS